MPAPRPLSFLLLFLISEGGVLKHIDRRNFLKATGTLALGGMLPFQLAQAAGETLTVGFIYPGPRNDSGWNEV